MSVKKELTAKQKGTFPEGSKAEERAMSWLKEHKFTDVSRNPKPTGCWDIMARKGNKNWIIEVKTGERPPINIDNFEKMINVKGIDKIGLALVTEKYIHLLEYPKQRFAAFKAWDTINKKREQRLQQSKA